MGRGGEGGGGGGRLNCCVHCIGLSLRAAPVSLDIQLVVVVLCGSLLPRKENAMFK